MTPPPFPFPLFQYTTNKSDVLPLFIPDQILYPPPWLTVFFCKQHPTSIRYFIKALRYAATFRKSFIFPIHPLLTLPFRLLLPTLILFPTQTADNEMSSAGSDNDSDSFSIIGDDMEVGQMMEEMGEDAVTFEDMHSALYVRVTVVERRGDNPGLQMGGVALWERNGQFSLQEVQVCGLACDESTPAGPTNTALEILSPHETQWVDREARSVILQLHKPSVLHAYSLRSGKLIQHDTITWTVDAAQSPTGPWRLLSKTNHTWGDALPSRSYGWSAPFNCDLVSLHPSSGKRGSDLPAPASLRFVSNPYNDVLEKEGLCVQNRASIISSVATTVWSIGQTFPWRASVALYMGFLCVQGVKGPVWCVLTANGIESECQKVSRSVDGITKIELMEDDTGKSAGFRLVREKKGVPPVTEIYEAAHAKGWVSALASLTPCRVWTSAKTTMHTLAGVANTPLQKIAAPFLMTKKVF